MMKICFKHSGIATAVRAVTVTNEEIEEPGFCYRQTSEPRAAFFAITGEITLDPPLFSRGSSTRSTVRQIRPQVLEFAS